MLRLEKRNKLEKQLGLLVSSFLKLGFTAFGGPAAAYAMMRQEFVSRRQWISEDEYFKFLGMANIIPGPNATEMAMLIGYSHAGIVGLILAGICYILPAMLVVLFLSWMYVQFGTLPEMSGILSSITPVIVAILISAMWGMVKPRKKNILGLAAAVIVFIAYLLGVGPFILLVAAGLSLAFIKLWQEKHQDLTGFIPLLPFLMRFPLAVQDKEPFSLLKLFWLFFKAGALMYGSGYVLLAFIYEDLVVKLGWLTNSQLVEAIAIGQITPGPLATTATFVGYVLGGIPAAILATLAMFMPSFMITGLVILFMNKFRLSERLSGLFEGVSFGALGLMAGVTWEIMRASITDPFSAAIAIISLTMILWLDVSAPWLVLSGAVIGLVRTLIG